MEVSITCTHINAQSQARTMTDVAFVRNCSHSLPDPQQRLRERADVIKARRPGAGFVEQQRHRPTEIWDVMVCSLAVSARDCGARLGGLKKEQMDPLPGG